MVTDVATFEKQKEKMVNMIKIIEELTIRVQSQDAQIAKLMTNVNNTDTSRVKGKRVAEEHDEAETSDRCQPMEEDAILQTLNISSDGFVPIYQIKEIVIGTIKDKLGESTKSSLTYAKWYTKRIDSLKMLACYQPPKLQQFDGKGNSKQHVTYFIEMCNDARTYGDHLVKQFVRLLKGNAFDWYIDLESNYIGSWDQMEQEFLNRFYITRRMVSMIELTNTRQMKDEYVIC
ncbi:hypothetical protein ACS0TY_026430 [Phlomoides rotata]